MNIKAMHLVWGIERLAMLKYGISDLRTFFDSDLRWNKHWLFTFEHTFDHRRLKLDEI